MKKKLFALLLALALILSLSASVFAYTVPSDTVVYVTETGSRYHRWDCSHLKSIGASYPISYAEALGYSPCSRCNPEWLLGAYEPSDSSSSSGSSSHSSSSSSSSSSHRYTAPPVSTDSSTNGSWFNWEYLLECLLSIISVFLIYPALFLFVALVCLVFSLFSWVHTGITEVFKKEPHIPKTPTTPKAAQPSSPPALSAPQKLPTPSNPVLEEKPPAVPAPVSAPRPVPQILGQTAALYTLLSPNLLQSSDYASALQSFSSWAQTCGFSVHRAFSFSDVCFPDVPLKQRAEFMVLLSLCKQADRPFDVLLVQHPYCLSLDPQKLEKIRRGFDDLGVKLFFRYLPPSDTVSSKL